MHPSFPVNEPALGVPNQEKIIGHLNEGSAVTVAVRIKPLLPDQSSVLGVSSQEEGGLIGIDNRVYAFDLIFREKAENLLVYQHLVESSILGMRDGINTLIMAYGGTGSGKTFSMGLEARVEGIISLSVKQIFDLAKELDLKVYLTFVEIYGSNPTSGKDNAGMRNLLQENPPVLKVGYTPQGMRNALGLAHLPNFEAFENAFEMGLRQRTTGSHGFNDKTSRSHAILEVSLASAQYLKESKPPVVKATFCDLAGSEPSYLWYASRKESPQYNEAVVINMSLGNLKKCFQELEAHQKPSINSATLTRYLGEYFQKNFNRSIRVLCCLAADAGVGGLTASLSRSTLEYASQLKNIKINLALKQDLQLRLRQKEPGLVFPDNIAMSDLEMLEKSMAADSMSRQPFNRGEHQGDVFQPDFRDPLIMFLDEEDIGELEERPLVELSPGETYEGQWRGDAFSGHGTYRKEVDGRTFTYVGQFRRNRFSLMGTYEVRSTNGTGITYEGAFRGGFAEGKGKLTSRTAAYVGDFKGNLKHGQGTESFVSGARFEGTCVLGKKTGPGVYRFADGSEYRGQFVNDQFSGEGKLLDAHQAYEGQWMDNVPHGHGVQQLGEQETYKGQFLGGKRHGFGEYAHLGKDHFYAGGWRDNKFDGRGTRRVKSKEIRGIWDKANLLIKQKK